MPVPALGVEQSPDEWRGNAMKLVADDMQPLVLRGCRHWVAEQDPEDLPTALTAFLTPYCDGTAGVPATGAENEATA
jgi:hypothetical protein